MQILKQVIILTEFNTRESHVRQLAKAGDDGIVVVENVERGRLQEDKPSPKKRWTNRWGRSERARRFGLHKLRFFSVSWRRCLWRAVTGRFFSPPFSATTPILPTCRFSICGRNEPDPAQCATDRKAAPKRQVRQTNAPVRPLQTLPKINRQHR